MRWRLADTLTKNMVERLAELAESSQNGATGGSSILSNGGGDTPVRPTLPSSSSVMASPQIVILPRLNIAASVPTPGVAHTSSSAAAAGGTAGKLPAGAVVPPLALPITSSSPLGSVSKPSGDELPSWAQSVK